MAKKILGLDLGVASIGWAVIEENENSSNILAMGSRIIPLNEEEKKFEQGTAKTKNQSRTDKRSQRRGYERYQLRRKSLTKELIKQKMFDKELFTLPQLELWSLRNKAITEQLSLPEIGRILYHLNQKRGYKSMRNEKNADKKDTDYVDKVKNRYQLLIESNKTIGQYFYNELLTNPHYRTKEQVFPREAYIEEYDKLMQFQQNYYPEVLNQELIGKFRNNIIFFQRPLKSQKGLVSVCELEGKWIKLHDGSEHFTGPKVAPKSSPIFQVEKIWEMINNLEIKDKYNKKLDITLDKKKEIYDYLDKNEKLSKTNLFKILDLKSEDGFHGNKQIDNGLQGNVTKSNIIKALSKFEYKEDIVDFDLNQVKLDGEGYRYDIKTGEIIESLPKYEISAEFEQQPLYRLWHIIYSISDENECIKTLVNKFNLSREAAESLSHLDFKSSAFGNKSARAMRKILPYLMLGYHYSEAAQFAGYNHSNSITKDQLLQKQLKDKINILQKILYDNLL